MNRWILAVFLFCTPNLFAQVHWTPPPVLINVNGFTKVGVGITVTLCATSSTGIPCTPALYTFVTDGSGNINNAVVTAGDYDVTLTGTGIIGSKYTTTIGGGSGTGLPAGGSVGQVVVNTAPGAGTWQSPGVVTRVVGGTTATDTILAADCNPARVAYQGSVSVAVTLPTAATLGVSQCVFRIANNTSGSSTTVTVTPTTWTFKNSGSTLVLAQGQYATIYVDPSGNQWDADVFDGLWTAGVNVTITRGQYGPSIASSGGGGAGAQIYAWPIQSVIAGSTTNVCLAFSPQAACAASGNDNRVGTPAGVAGTVQSVCMWINQSANAQPTPGNFVVTLRINGASSTSVITIAQGATVTTVQCDTTHHPTVAQGDLLAMQFANAATTNSIVPATVVVAIQ
jgi:hypothetical protein